MSDATDTLFQGVNSIPKTAITKQSVHDPMATPCHRVLSHQSVLGVLMELIAPTFGRIKRLRRSGYLFNAPVSMANMAIVISIIVYAMLPSIEAGPLGYNDDLGYYRYYGRQGRDKRQYVEGADGIKVDAAEYLIKHGYLPYHLHEARRIRDEDLKLGLTRLQTYAHLNLTGHIDDATTDVILTPRCGVKDLPTSSIHSSHHKHRHRHGMKQGENKWLKQHLTYIILDYPRAMSTEDIHMEIHRAFMVWSEVVPLQFEELDHGDADITFQFERHYHEDTRPFDGTGLEYGHAFSPNENRGGEIHLDYDESWTLDSNQGINLYNAAVHEIGHVLGLPHSNNDSDVMYPWYTTFRPKVELGEGDIKEAQTLYGRRHVVVDGEEMEEGGYTQKYHDLKPTTSLSPTPTTTNTTTQPPTTMDPNSPPDPCTTHVDAAANIRGDLFFFKGKWLWRIGENGTMDGYPVTLDRMWYGLPSDFTHIDAAYERPVSGKIVFFQGDRYYVFTDHKLDYEYLNNGRPITELGFPSDIKKVDAAFIWGHNQRTYFITGDMYWRFDEREGVVEEGYPRDMRLWRGVHLPVNAVLRDIKGVTHFFKGLHYWKFNDTTMEADHDRKYIGYNWLTCPVNHDSTSLPVLGNLSLNPNSSGRFQYSFTSLTSLTLCTVFMKYILTDVL